MRGHSQIHIFYIRKESGLKRGTDWMLQAWSTMRQCCDVHVVSTLGRECSEWPEGATNAEILTLVEEYSRPGTVVVFKNRLVS